AKEFGVHPVHLGIIFLANLEIGYITPPVGLNLFIASNRFGRPLAEVWRTTVPFLLLRLAALALITYISALSLAPLRWVTGLP
ncbi:MAG: TRAP transporter large permease subunit, partial [Nitrospinota bacterium]|nr:TRAP transporter large permease subunit [Nitrospinota bacterium]